jgi:hypothetical protein
LAGLLVIKNARMTDFYHMSADLLVVGTKIPGNGKDKVNPRIEAELEKRRPSGLLSRKDAVYARPISNFSRCGIVIPATSTASVSTAKRSATISVGSVPCKWLCSIRNTLAHCP